ncbi:hypothetical protein B4140_2819 [Bacillus amyloliquefaciens]|nr:hypothetical protein B4140_2819 [Bacillus amyloliquefaciens]
MTVLLINKDTEESAFLSRFFFFVCTNISHASTIREDIEKSDNMFLKAL